MHRKPLPAATIIPMRGRPRPRNYVVLLGLQKVEDALASGQGNGWSGHQE